MLPTETSGVLMCWLLKGDRRESPKGSGRWLQCSPLIRGWKRFRDDGTTQYAHSYRWEDATGGHMLGKGWSQFDAWTEPGGVRGWVERLASGKVQPEAGDCLSEQWVMPAPYYRQPGDVADWVRQAAGTEHAQAEMRECVYQDAGDDMALDIGFPQHRHSCSYPSRCAYYQLCWGPPHVRANPLENGFTRRVPYVVAETEVEP